VPLLAFRQDFFGPIWSKMGRLALAPRGAVQSGRKIGFCNNIRRPNMNDLSCTEPFSNGFPRRKDFSFLHA
jgi:hypothetical protein